MVSSTHVAAVSATAGTASTGDAGMTPMRCVARCRHRTRNRRPLSRARAHRRVCRVWPRASSVVHRCPWCRARQMHRCCRTGRMHRWCRTGADQQVLSRRSDESARSAASNTLQFGRLPVTKARRRQSRAPASSCCGSRMVATASQPATRAVNYQARAGDCRFPDGRDRAHADGAGLDADCTRVDARTRHTP